MLNLVSIVSGVTSIVIPRFEPHDFLGAIARYKITQLPLSPPMVLLLATSPLVDEYDVTCIQ
jgi:hypothetical protein